MRFAELNLVAYGKFTDYKLDFPMAGRDFHVIIGPNEAGKSTVRRAVSELLFGMEMRSPLGFKHAQSDLRVSGILESGSTKLPFMRTKQQKSLRTMSGDVLQESFLTPALGALKQDVFEELHCLDHARLLRGGQGIVDPKNTVSQILFQAASGLEDFAAIREALGERANELFAKGGKNNQFTRVSERFSLAQKTIKEVQVRTKTWVDARDALHAADEALAQERKKRRELELNRTSWDRARRLTPLVDALARLQQELVDAGEVTSFPPNAKQVLESGIEQMNTAAARLQTREEDVTRAQRDFNGVEVDAAVLEHAVAIAGLAALCGLHPNHARDLPVRRAEVEGWLSEVFVRSAQFNWGGTEEEVRTRLPQDKDVCAIDALLKTRGALLAQGNAASDAHEERQAEVNDLKERLESAVSRSVGPQLMQALELALSYKNSEAKQKTLANSAASAQTSANNSLAALGRPEMTAELLRVMRYPALERISGYRTNREKVLQAMDLERSLGEQSKVSAAENELALSQFERSHQVVTFSEVSAARRHRDDQWVAIKTGGTTLAEGALGLDGAIRLADELGDSRTRSEADAAEVTTLRDQLERATDEQRQHEVKVKNRQQELEEFDARWSEAAAEMGLAGLELDDVPEWLMKKDAVLQAADMAAQRHREYESERDEAAQAKVDLVKAMSNAGLIVNETFGLAALCAVVDRHIKDANLGRTRRQDLEQRFATSEGALKVAAKAMESKAAAVKAWDASWQGVLARANLAGVEREVAEVESAILACEFIHQRLERVDNARVERIQTMEDDLERMKEAARLLAQSVAPALAVRAPEEVLSSLTSRLEDARRQQDRFAQALKYLDEAKHQRDTASSQLQEAKRSLEPLLKLAGVEEPMLARPIVEQWQAKIARESELADVLRRLELGSDGLSLAEIQVEVVSHPAAHAGDQVIDLKDQLADSDTRVTSLVADQVSAKQRFNEIDGSDKAAVAEAQRHEALAEMSDVSEEYLQVATANCLLKWAVDRYRDRKQGPLLQRASGIFRNLTRGSFEKLRVDFDQSTPALVAYRPNNQAVKVSGLSDGTRDQLFLALRIAALELQADQGTPMPFIADDLFINFDDERSQAGLKALYEMSSKTQVLFLSHQEHLVPIIEKQFPGVNLITLKAEELSA